MCCCEFTHPNPGSAWWCHLQGGLLQGFWLETGKQLSPIKAGQLSQGPLLSALCEVTGGRHWVFPDSSFPYSGWLCFTLETRKATSSHDFSMGPSHDSSSSLHYLCWTIPSDACKTDQQGIDRRFVWNGSPTVYRLWRKNVVHPFWTTPSGNRFRLLPLAVFDSISLLFTFY